MAQSGHSPLPSIDPIDPVRPKLRVRSEVVARADHACNDMPHECATGPTAREGNRSRSGRSGTRSVCRDEEPRSCGRLAIAGESAYPRAAVPDVAWRHPCAHVALRHRARGLARSARAGFPPAPRSNRQSTGRLPVGNTGRANVSAFDPMPIPADLWDEMSGDHCAEALRDKS